MEKKKIISPVYEVIDHELVHVRDKVIEYEDRGRHSLACNLCPCPFYPECRKTCQNEEFRLKREQAEKEKSQG